MKRRRVLLAVLGLMVLLGGAWALTVALDRIMRRPPAEEAATSEPAAQPAQPAVRHITATLFFGSADGRFLVPVQREVPFGEGTVEQGRQIVLAQIREPAPPPLVSPIPAGTTLRSFYVNQSDAFVDLGPEVTTAHPGGSVAELFTVYAIVNAVTANLSAITRVQILINGQEVDTLAGHVDLRRPLERNDSLVRQAGTP